MTPTHFQIQEGDQDILGSLKNINWRLTRLPEDIRERQVAGDQTAEAEALAGYEAAAAELSLAKERVKQALDTFAQSATQLAAQRRVWETTTAWRWLQTLQKANTEQWSRTISHMVQEMKASDWADQWNCYEWFQYVYFGDWTKFHEGVFPDGSQLAVWIRKSESEDRLQIDGYGIWMKPTPQPGPWPTANMNYEAMLERMEEKKGQRSRYSSF